MGATPQHSQSNVFLIPSTDQIRHSFLRTHAVPDRTNILRALENKHRNSTALRTRPQADVKFTSTASRLRRYSRLPACSMIYKMPLLQQPNCQRSFQGQRPKPLYPAATRTETLCLSDILLPDRQWPDSSPSMKPATNYLIISAFSCQRRPSDGKQVMLPRAFNSSIAPPLKFAMSGISRAKPAFRIGHRY
jgi:hypothetical protein